MHPFRLLRVHQFFAQPYKHTRAISTRSLFSQKHDAKEESCPLWELYTAALDVEQSPMEWATSNKSEGTVGCTPLLTQNRTNKKVAVKLLIPD